ncbi:hypothetical protein PF006_g14266 [Phytophthora fragariae]|uniref:Uncharacterized protein n=1 Tax=Phytophthora fragariae TaxID=53985 RepID=A0A6A3THW5_9STRA|nr:hypothetical protein PF006_g14266 [Phytophthora fragariae]
MGPTGSPLKPQILNSGPTDTLEKGRFRPVYLGQSHPFDYICLTAGSVPTNLVPELSAPAYHASHPAVPRDGHRPVPAARAATSISYWYAFLFA